MNEDFIGIFVDKLVCYLEKVVGESSQVGSPYLVSNDHPISYDITGLIGISGNAKGCIYFSAPKEFLVHTLISQGLDNISDENLLDMAGEIANTISGNVRSELGEQFMISTPIVMQGHLSSVHLPKDTRSYVIPIHWEHYTPVLSVSVEPPG